MNRRYYSYSVFTGLSIFAINVLKNNSIDTIDKLVDAIKTQRINKMRNCGQKTVVELMNWVFLNTPNTDFNLNKAGKTTVNYKFTVLKKKDKRWMY